MDMINALTVSKLTPPGYFNLSEDAPAFHKAYITWWNAILARRATQADALRELVLTPWLVNHPDSPRTVWLNYWLTQYGMSYFGGTNNQAAAIFKLVSNAWQRSTLANMLLIINTLSSAPFSWFSTDSIIPGYYVPLDVDPGFIVYSNAVSIPATPAPTAYAARAWVSPTGFTKAAASSTFYTRGYKSGLTVVWCAPRSVSDFLMSRVYSAAVPVAVSPVGTVCIVDDDSTGDRSTIYYSDGAVWRKNSTPNADLGEVIPVSITRPVPEAVAVWSPNPALVTYAVESETPPPVSGATQGFGTFAGWASVTVATGQTIIQLTQIAGGAVAMATLFDLLRRVKPVGKSFFIIVDGVTYKILDTRQA